MGGCYSSPQYTQAPPLLPTNPQSLPPEGPAAVGLGVPPRVKLVLLGESGVGKSCLVLRFTRGHFDPGCRATVGAAFSSASVTAPGIEGATCKMEIWDTAGQERYQSLAPLYYRGAHAAAIVYDITQRATFARAEFWLSELRAYTRSGPGMVIVLVGNKADLAPSREVPEEDGRQLADSVGALFVEASAATGANVAEIFEGVVARLAGGMPVSVNAAAPCVF